MMRLEVLVAAGLLLLIGGGLALIGFLLLRGADGNAVAVITSVLMALVSLLAHVVRNKFPGPELETEPPHDKPHRRFEDEQ